MSHPPVRLSLLNRLSQTESAIFKLWRLYFQKITFQIIERSQQLSLNRVVALKSRPVHRYSIVMFTLSGALGL